MLRLGPGFDRSVFQRQSGIWNDEIEIETDRVAKTLAARAGAVGIIETEESRFGRRVNRMVVLAFEMLGEPELFWFAIGGLNQRGAVSFQKTDLQ